MNTLTGIDFQLPYGTLVQVRVTPTNNKGTGPPSDQLIFGATIRTIPKAPQIPTRGLMTSENKIQIDWIPIVSASDRGNSPILSYRMMWDSQTGTSNILLVESIIFTYTIPGLLSHKPYKFKVQARNIYGYGSFSDEAIIYTTDVPHPMDTLVSSKYGDNTQVTWIEPQTGGQPILEYQIKIFVPYLKEFVEDPTCVPATTTQRSCFFTMNYLEDTYGYKYGDLL